MSKMKLILSVILTFLSLSIMGNNKTSKFDYSSKWSEIDRLMDNPLLKDAQKKVDEIRATAKKEKDELNQLRCAIYDYAIDLGCEYNITADIRNTPRNANREEGEDIIINHYKKASELKDAFKSPVEKACCELFMAKMMMNFIDVMERYPGAVPSVKDKEEKQYAADNLREMSHEEIRKQIRNHVNNIVKDKETLLSTSSEKYRSLFMKSNEITDEYKTLRPSLFDAMLPSLFSFYYEHIEFNHGANLFYLPIHLVKKDLLKEDFINSVFADVINYHNSKGEYSAALYAELDRLSYLERYNYIDNEDKIETINNLIKQYEGKTSCVVYAVVKKHNVMCETISALNTGRVSSETIESYPKLIIDETDKYKKLYPNHPGIKDLNNIIKWIKNAEVNGNVDPCFGKGKDVKIGISYANIDLLDAYIYRIDMNPLDIEKNGNREEVKNALLKVRKPLAIKSFKLAPSNYIIHKDTTINIGNELDYGKYILRFKGDGINSDDDLYNNYVTFTVSDLSILDINSIGEKRNVFIVDGETGHPVKGADVEKYDVRNREYNLKEKQNTSVDGKATIALSDNHYYRLHTQKGKDIYAPWTNIIKNNPYTQRPDYRINILTDRSIYRPGQNIEGKAVLTFLSQNDEHVIENQKIKLILKDANRKKIEEKEVFTNEFGSAAFKFNIPADRMNGEFSIEAISKNEIDTYRGYHNITVESYKLPVAEAKVYTKDGSSIMYGSKPVFEGEVKAFSGEAVGGTVVKYRISEAWSSNILSSGETKCENDGKFTIVSDSAITKGSYYIEIEIEAVLPSGETVTASHKLNLADSAVIGQIRSLNNQHLNEYFIEKGNSLNVNVNLTNNARFNEEAEAILVVETIEDKERNIACKTLISKNIKGKGDLTETLDISPLAPSSYEIKLKTLSGDIIAKEDIVVYDKNSSKLPEGLKEYIWCPNKYVDCTPSSDAKILIGSSEKDAKILAIVRDDDGKYLHDDWININNEQKTYKITYNKFFANNDTKSINVEFIIVRNQQLMKEIVYIKRKETKEKHEIEVLEIVRNIVPGEKQKVKMKVKPASNNFEIAAVMVDKSLQGMLPNWHTLPHFHTYRNRYESIMPYIYSRHFAIGGKNIYYGEYRRLPNINFLWDNINMPNSYAVPMADCTGAVSTNGMMRKSSPQMLRSADVVEEEVMADYGVSVDPNIITKDQLLEETMIEDTIEDKFADVKVRENFVETAFFYPQLTTNADGSVEFEYTAPDALTAWKMFIFAHDKKVNSCITSEELQTKMPFTVKASLPRFVRKGDKCAFATTITNNDEIKTHGKSEIRKIMKGDVAIIVKDVATDKILLQQSHEFNVAAQSSVVEEWSFDVPAGVAAIEVKMVGKSGTFSDGEVHQLPVLADGTHVVKSKSMHVRGGETKDFSIPYNEKEMKDAELTVEYTDNAVWQALMALPSVKDAKYECATELISTIFVNQMAQRIANLYPEIPSVVEEWKREGIHATSPLEQNQELKNVLMQQTPWMCEAKNESEQRAKIVELYDKGRIAKANKDAISKLQKLQQSDGGIAWFADFKPSEYVTVYVAKYLVEMREYGVLPKECEKMLKSAVKYIDKALAEAYKNEIEKKWNANREWVFDVFKIRISYDKNLDNNTQKILDYYVDKAHKEIKEMTLYGKASFAIVLNMKGDEKEAKSIVESLRQSATETEELGMYWKENQDSWGRYGNAISTHAMLTKAFQKTGCDAKELSDLRFHLITKKETTQWNSTESTLAAIDALVGDGKATSDLRKKGNRTVANIKIGGTKVDAKRMAGDGYVKIHYNKESFTPELCNNIHIEQPAGQEGIGGIYIAYDAPYSEITSGKSGIEVKKKMYKVVIANDGDDDKEMLQEIKEGEKLKKGDKVKIVMTLRSDRDIDFVQVLDLRAACLEPVRKRPGMEWADGKFYYQSITDSEYSMFFDHISKGTRVFEYTLHVTQSGEYTQGITKVIPHYCPAFSANSEGGKVSVE